MHESGFALPTFIKYPSFSRYQQAEGKEEGQEEHKILCFPFLINFVNVVNLILALFSFFFGCFYFFRFLDFLNQKCSCNMTAEELQI